MQITAITVMVHGGGRAVKRYPVLNLIIVEGGRLMINISDLKTG